MVQRQRTVRRKAQVAVACGIGLSSFVTGILVATGIKHMPLTSRLRSPEEQPIMAQSLFHEPPISLRLAEQLETAGPADVVTTSQPSVPGSRVPATDSWVQPITTPGSLSAAANRLTVPLGMQSAVSLKAVGDIIPGTNFPDYRIPDPHYLFRSVQMFMGEVDIVFGNFESTLTNYPYSAKPIGQEMTFAFRTPPIFAETLRDAGFNVLNIANNHSFDFGDPGFSDTFDHIEQMGMEAIGRKDEITVVEANGYAIAFIGFSYWPDHNNMNDLARATQLVETAQSQADMVVISVHAGAEGTDALRVRNQTEYFFSENRGNLVEFSRAMVDAGADLILGHGPHVPRAMELYQQRLIAYSLGNFVGYRTLSTVGPLGKSMILQVELNSAGEFLRGRIIPVALDPNGVPYIDDFFESVTLVRQLTQNDFPNTPLTIDPMGYLLKGDPP
jgi:poly-gamma-glutamate capsule biosynthesis protein CapA/YwtB (metallophosphatase superfamily)